MKRLKTCQNDTKFCRTAEPCRTKKQGMADCNSLLHKDLRAIMPYCHRNIEKYLIINKKNYLYIKSFFRSLYGRSALDIFIKNVKTT